MTDLHEDNADDKDAGRDNPCPTSPADPDGTASSGLERKISDVLSAEKSVADDETPEEKSPENDQDKEKTSEDGQEELEREVDVEHAVEEANTTGERSETQSDRTSGQSVPDSSITARPAIKSGDPAAYGLEVPPFKQKKKTFSAKAASFTKNLWKTMKHAATSTAATSHRAMPQVDTRIAPLEPREIP
ncbi:MAG: hypothetical protein KVP17_000516 [Porospora cf. gigantea B]|uniref:uncharacterized protein n=1 Tax=Porospora cf. gigantea B TaxID=2853592 RepID=UPI003571B823|nr:MAG: hypothetical protein KVP17_000516 [Porospora cf. gigantea B]